MRRITAQFTLAHLPSLLWIALYLVCICLNDSNASSEFPKVEHCSNERGGGICPLGNTCCPRTNSSGSACIPSDLGPHFATCCPDGVSGCGVGYRCSTQPDDGSESLCIATTQIQDPLVQILPRYAPLCYNSSISNFQQIYGLSSSQLGSHDAIKMPYYSSHGDIAQLTHKERTSIRVAIIVIHGANRNADDYFCSMTSAVRLQTQYLATQVLVLAPRFLVPSDGAPNHFLQWQETRDGPWRYGANAIQPPAAQNTSSFDVVDVMVQQLVNNLPNLQSLTLVGHSSGGQFVQRWSLMSPYFYSYSTQQQSLLSRKNNLRMQAVVANPSSYAYLTPLRYNKTTDTWSKPDNVSDCPNYNDWEWGLETNQDTPPYVQRVLNEFLDPINPNHPYNRLIDRFASRRVIYLQGGLDRCNVTLSAYRYNISTTPSTPWCQSHGLETTCMDQLQGSNRWERNTLYMNMLHRVGVIGSNNISMHPRHHRVAVPMVGHDHTLMFTSQQGLQVLFGQQQEFIDNDSTFPSTKQ